MASVRFIENATFEGLTRHLCWFQRDQTDEEVWGDAQGGLMQPDSDVEPCSQGNAVLLGARADGLLLRVRAAPPWEGCQLGD